MSWQDQGRRLCVAFAKLAQATNTTKISEYRSKQDKWERTKTFSKIFERILRLLTDTETNELSWLESTITTDRIDSTSFLNATLVSKDLARSESAVAINAFLALFDLQIDSEPPTRAEIIRYSDEPKAVFEVANVGRMSSAKFYSIERLAGTCVLGANDYFHAAIYAVVWEAQRKDNFQVKKTAFENALNAMRESLRERKYLDVTYESGIVEREGYSDQVDLNGAKEGRALFEIALNAVGKPTNRDEMIAMVYQGEERANSAINGVRSTLNTKLEDLNLEVGKNFCLCNFRSEK